MQQCTTVDGPKNVAAATHSSCVLSSVAFALLASTNALETAAAYAASAVWYCANAVSSAWLRCCLRLSTYKAAAEALLRAAFTALIACRAQPGQDRTQPLQQISMAVTQIGFVITDTISFVKLGTCTDKHLEVYKQHSYLFAIA